ncbi:cysteine desulfurase family protein [Xylocopilactobacillus apis]|uniref:cysteine desulfurase n=1 Tax=Xylocopilactobacillus apis TaxID=2932183 RepID=A0AAU9D1J7_9LACO|nr:cysteine desulfurase family protein [Xylocopilactobacillus apis]BDR56150.1 cysteine desulfurase [Xylocopilactobacillus apis]
MNRYYFDHAATTPVAPEVIKVITDSLTNDFGNVSSTHFFGQREKLKLRNARKVMADEIHADLNEIYFTSGATESNNTVIRQVALKRANEGRHLITTSVEHPSVLNVMKYLSEHGYEVTFLPVNDTGAINLNDLKNALRPDTILVSIMAANNETGSLMPIKEIGKTLKDHTAWFHVDATQALGIEAIDVKELNIDFLSVSAHKIYGPKGIGFLYKNQKLVIPPLLLGGEQENKFRAGTTNLPLIMGFEAAMKLCTPKNEQEWAIIYREYKQIIIDELKNSGIEFEINGDLDHSLPQTINLWLKDIPSQVLIPRLDLDGFAVSAGSACTAGSAEDSHVLLAMYPDNLKRVRESIRISFGRDNNKNDVVKLAEELVKQVTHLKQKGQ